MIAQRESEQTAVADSDIQGNRGKRNHAIK